jgi:hypothetical protein
VRPGVCNASVMPESWSINHFSIVNPVGTDRADVPALLRRMADALDEYGPIEVQDLTFGTEVTEDGYVHDLTVYFHSKEETPS